MSDISKQINVDSIAQIKSVLEKQASPERIYVNRFELLFATCNLIGKYANIHFRKPSYKTSELDDLEYLHNIVKTTGIRVRKIKLGRNWWKTDNGPLLSFYNKTPCALIPKRKGGYELILLDKNVSINIANTLESLEPYAYCFYPTLPDSARNFTQVFKFILPTIKIDIKRAFIFQALSSLFLLFIPMITGKLFNSVIPSAAVDLLLQFVFILFFTIILLNLYNISLSIALIRFRNKTRSKLQPAIWNKLLRMPVHFFKGYPAGDLTMRSRVFSEILDEFSASVVLSLLAGSMSFITLIFMFFYSVILSVALLGLTLIIAIVSFILNLKRLRPSLTYFQQRNKLTGFVFEVLNALAKVRVANADSRIFSLWTEIFVKKSKAEFKQLHNLLKINVFTTGVVIFCIFVIYTITVLLGKRLSFGDFIVFNAAFGIFITSFLSAISTLSNMIEVIPLFKLTQPILDNNIEKEENVSEPGCLNGDIQIKEVVFRYHENEKPIFKNLSLKINSGEFVALVGPSGAGKSSIFRLLLGFEKPESGEILYNGINLHTLRLSSIREQIGCVIQHSSLTPGSILDNIVGTNSKLSRSDAWEIAEKVGIAEMIHELPMGMDTIIIDGINTLSGGQAQRLMIARALAKTPKILFLDEATSALDNTSQKLIYNHLRKLKVTQVVAAHRLSTIVEADRIYVIDNGEIVETGSYNELIAQDQLFASLIKRQLV